MRGQISTHCSSEGSWLPGSNTCKSIQFIDNHNSPPHARAHTPSHPHLLPPPDTQRCVKLLGILEQHRISRSAVLKVGFKTLLEDSQDSPFCCSYLCSNRLTTETGMRIQLPSTKHILSFQI